MPSDFWNIAHAGPPKEGAYHLSNDDWYSWWAVNVLYKKNTVKLAIRTPETGKIISPRGLPGWSWLYIGPPICPICKNNRQVWRNQLTNNWRCHRVSCEKDIEL